MSKFIYYTLKQNNNISSNYILKLNFKNKNDYLLKPYLDKEIEVDQAFNSEIICEKDFYFRVYGYKPSDES